MEIQNPSLFELNNVHQVYEIISEHFDKTRYHTWPIIDKFIKSFNKGSLIGDIGCGNGRNCLVRDDCKFIGTDISESLVNICKKLVGQKFLKRAFLVSKFENIYNFFEEI